MEPVLFAAGCFTAAVALAAGIYASFTARGKGPVLSNSYWFSVLKRENANKKAEYRWLNSDKELIYLSTVS